VYKVLESYLLAGISAAGDDGDSADLEELHLALRVVLPGEGELCCVGRFRRRSSVTGNLVENSGEWFVGLQIGA
jgi:hypothetical protein